MLGDGGTWTSGRSQSMDNINQRGRGKSLSGWFKLKHKRAENTFRFGDLLDEGDYEEDDDDNVFEQLSASLLEMDPYALQNELRIFVGTWNVNGRSPVGSLAVDLDDWLNLKDAADMYVLGFQEIVPLKTRNVIGAEDVTEASNWNMHIGKALNKQYGNPRSTPMIHPVSNDNCQYANDPDYEQHRGSTSDATSVMEENSDSTIMPNGLGKYKLMASKKMVGVFISVWMRRELPRKYHISNVKVCSVPCGIMNYFGNKGSVSVSMAIEGTSFCFIAAHLASGEKKGDQGRRNQQVSEIFKRTSFPRSHRDADETHPLTIHGHDQIFWFGDLNYRLYLEKHMTGQLIKRQDWRALQKFDQLRREQEDGVFQGWEEGDIKFAPTYKYSSSNGNRYSSGLPRQPGEKPRTPAWCDRILWYGKGVRQLSYFRSEIKFSDHRPVSALFSTQIKAVKSSSRVVPLPTVHPTRTSCLERENSMQNQEPKSTLLSMIMEDTRSSAREVRRVDREILLEADDLPSSIL